MSNIDDLVQLARLVELDALARLREARDAEMAARSEAGRISDLQRRAIAEEGQDTARRVSQSDPAWSIWLGQRRGTLNTEIAQARVRQDYLSRETAYHVARHAALAGIQARVEVEGRAELRKAQDAELQALLPLRPKR
ncbi:hypothetical protein SAMN05421759_10161 [Roseivivax lentus]|uniref:Flagellar FliJ protein n=1 Tax=Roseivivax lentus TaxID=633194 RepID=A0A1N7JLM0_9RHOB|nr:hypothetical protein [Roseivivax lentus]SIS50156.1 hypothetical protein SAMN05421759_10161 [Roseivivax lentus]